MSLCYIDFIEIAVVVVPIVAPILLADPAANITAVWLGVMVGLNMQTSFLTPPFGFSLFYLGFPRVLRFSWVWTQGSHWVFPVFPWESECSTLELPPSYGDFYFAAVSPVPCYCCCCCSAVALVTAAVRVCWFPARRPNGPEVHQRPFQAAAGLRLAFSRALRSHSPPPKA